LARAEAFRASRQDRFDETGRTAGRAILAAGLYQNDPNVVMIVGLQGSGKTTSTGKIARWLAQNQQRKPLLLSTDVTGRRRANS